MNTMFSLKEVQKLMYQAYKHGQGGESQLPCPFFEGQKLGRLSTQNHRFKALRRLFPKLFPRPTTRQSAAELQAVDTMIEEYRAPNTAVL